MNTGALAEWEFWENLSDNEREINTAGMPPYNAAEVAYMLIGMLDYRRVSSLGVSVEHVLDLGCGTGRLTYEMASRLTTTVLHGVDISKAMLSRVARNWTGNMRTHLGDGRTLPEELDAVPFDAAYSVTMFQHIPVEAQRGYVLAVADQMVCGGKFAFTVALGGTETFLEHRVDYGIVEGWCVNAGLAICDFLPTDSRGWAWFVTVKL